MLRLSVTLTILALGALAAPKVLLDASQGVGAWTGLTLEKRQDGDGQAASWEGAGKGGLISLKLEKADFSAYNRLRFELYSPDETPRKIAIVAVSTNPDVGSWNYFLHFQKVNWKGWKTLSIPLSRFTLARQPLGWKSIDELNFYSKGWNVEPVPGTVFQVDKVAFEFDEKLAQRQKKRPPAHRSTKVTLEPWTGKMSFPTFPLSEIQAYADASPDCKKLLTSLLSSADRQITQKIFTRKYKLDDIPERERDGRYKYAGDNGELFALAMNDCTNGSRLRRYLVPVALAAKLTGKKEYLDWAIEQLREIATWSPLQRPGWTAYNPTRKLPPGGDGNWLATGYAMVGLVHTLHLLDGMLPEDLRLQLHGLLQKEIDSIQDDWKSKRPWFVRSDYPATNQWVLPNTAMIYACLYLGEESNRGAYELGVKNLARTCLAQGEDGSWSEGLGYGLMSAEYLFQAVWILSLNGDERLASYGFCKNFSNWIGHMLMPGNYCVNAFDCGTYQLSKRPANSFMLNALLAGTPESRWFAQKIFTASPNSFTGLLYQYYNRGASDKTAEPAPFAFFPHQQVFTWRSDWNQKCAMGLWIRGGSKRDSHSHRDNGHISIYNGSIPILIEAGTSNYADRDLPLKYANKKGHNILQTEAVTPSGRGCHAPLAVDEIDAKGGKVTIDGTGAFTDTEDWTRQIAWQATGEVKIEDSVELTEAISAGTELFRFHTASTTPLTITGSGKSWTAAWDDASFRFEADREITITQQNWPDRSGRKEHLCLSILPGKQTDSLKLTSTLTFTRREQLGSRSPTWKDYQLAYKNQPPGRGIAHLQAEEMTGNDPRFTLSEKKIGAKKCIYNWNDVGQKLSASFQVEQTGWYRILVRNCTGATLGIPVRSIYIDNTIPIRECAELVFPDTGGWSGKMDNWKETVIGQSLVPGGFRFHLTKGKHALTLVNEGGGGLNVDDLLVYPANLSPQQARQQSNK